METQAQTHKYTYTPYPPSRPPHRHTHTHTPRERPSYRTSDRSLFNESGRVRRETRDPKVHGRFSRETVEKEKSTKHQPNDTHTPTHTHSTHNETRYGDKNAKHITECATSKKTTVMESGKHEKKSSSSLCMSTVCCYLTFFFDLNVHSGVHRDPTNDDARTNWATYRAHILPRQQRPFTTPKTAQQHSRPENLWVAGRRTRLV